MRAHYLQHVPFEGLGSIEAWLLAKGFQISCTPFYQSVELPALEAVDFLVIMGGPMSVNDEVEYPWLVAEKQYVREFVESGKPVLGICLGAQLIASAMGGEVFPNRQAEIGWFPVRAVAQQADNVFSFPESAEVFHWHGETFSLPPGAVHLADSRACRHQAFQFGANCIGLQFHLETTPQSARDIVSHCGDELVAGEYIQSASQILDGPGSRYAVINALMADILDFLLVNNRQAVSEH